METKCSNCSGPVFIPLDRGVANCKNCGQLAGRYCIQCNIAMPKGTEYCSSCGLSYADTQKLAIKNSWQKHGKKFVNTMLVTLVLIVGGLFVMNNLYKGGARNREAAEAKSKAKQAQELLQDTQFVETEIRPLIEQAGAKLIYTNPHILRIQLPGPVSEYEAERLAKSVLDRLPNGTAVKVLDDVGILRAEASNSIFSNR